MTGSVDNLDNIFKYGVGFVVGTLTTAAVLGTLSVTGVISLKDIKLGSVVPVQINEKKPVLAQAPIVSDGRVLVSARVEQLGTHYKKKHANDYCQVAQRGSDGKLIDKISCFALSVDKVERAPDVVGFSYDSENNSDGSWSSVSIIHYSENKFDYSYEGVTVGGTGTVSRSFVNFAQGTGYFISNSRGYVSFKLIPLKQALEKVNLVFDDPTCSLRDKTIHLSSRLFGGDTRGARCSPRELLSDSADSFREHKSDGRSVFN